MKKLHFTHSILVVHLYPCFCFHNFMHDVTSNVIAIIFPIQFKRSYMIDFTLTLSGIIFSNSPWLQFTSMEFKCNPCVSNFMYKWGGKSLKDRCPSNFINLELIHKPKPSTLRILMFTKFHELRRCNFLNFLLYHYTSKILQLLL